MLTREQIEGFVGFIQPFVRECYGSDGEGMLIQLRDLAIHGLNTEAERLVGIFDRALQEQVEPPRSTEGETQEPAYMADASLDELLEFWGNHFPAPSNERAAVDIIKNLRAKLSRIEAETVERCARVCRTLYNEHKRSGSYPMDMGGLARECETGIRDLLKGTGSTLLQDAERRVAELEEALGEALEIAEQGLVIDYGFSHEASIAPRKRIAELRKLREGK